MTFDPVPWAIGGGAVMDVEVLRLLAHLASEGREGIVGIGDLKVRANAPTNGTVIVGKGAAAALNRFVAADGGQQSYLLRNPADQAGVAINPTAPGVGRTDLVAVIVEDPQYAGQPAPASVADGPYVRVKVYEGVPAGTTSLTQVDPGQVGLALARVAIPANTSAITDAMITSLRTMLSFRVEPFVVSLNTAGHIAMPGPGLANWIGNVDCLVPSWANRLSLKAAVSGAVALGGSAGAQMRAVLTGASGTIATEAIAGTISASGRFPTTIVGVSGLVIPAAMRGQSLKLWVQGAQTGGTGAAEADSYTAAHFDLLFSQAPE